MKCIFLLVLFIFAQYACESKETQNFDLKTFTLNFLNMTRNQTSAGSCQKPSFANQTVANRKFVSVDRDAFKQYLEIVDLNVVDGLAKNLELLNWLPSEETKNNFPVYMSGYDSQNQPIWIIELGKHQFIKHTLGGRETQALQLKYYRFLIFQAFKSMAFMSNKESPIHQCNIIFDFEGINPLFVLKPKAVQFAFKTAWLLRHWFSKHVVKIVILNVNQVTEIVLNQFRSFIARFLEKSEVYGTNRAFWIPQLMQSFPKDQLPEKYGGCKGFLPINVV